MSHAYSALVKALAAELRRAGITPPRTGRRSVPTVDAAAKRNLLDLAVQSLGSEALVTLGRRIARRRGHPLSPPRASSM